MLKNIFRKAEPVGEPVTQHTFTVLFEPAEEGGYIVMCPALPGLVSEGDTLDDARKMAKDAIQLYLESLLQDRLPVPKDVQPIKETISVAVA